MRKRIVDLSFGEQPLLDIGAYARGARVVTPARRLQIALTVHRAPEVMVKVSGGARTVAAVGKHIAYVGLTRLGGPLMVRFRGVHNGGQIGPVYTGV